MPAKKLSPRITKALKTKADKSKRCNLTDLKAVFKRGEGAYLSSGSRPGVSMEQWAFGRVNSFIRGGSHDTDIKRRAAKRRNK